MRRRLLRTWASEVDLQPELNLPRRRHRRGDSPRRRIDEAPRLEDDAVRGVRNREVRVVQGVEKLGAELDRALLRQGKMFRQREIEVDERRSNERVPAQAAYGIGRLQLERV